MHESIKAMPLFFIDNQQAWPKTAKLVGDGFVIWPDDGMYPGYTPIASATHPMFDGTIVVQAGQRGIVVSFLEKVIGAAAIKKAMSDKTKRPEQYRIAVDSLVQRVVIMTANEQAGIQQDSVHPYSLMSWMGKAHAKETAVLTKALEAYLPKAGSGEDFETAEEMLRTLKQGQESAKEKPTSKTGGKS